MLAANKTIISIILSFFTVSLVYLGLGNNFGLNAQSSNSEKISFSFENPIFNSGADPWMLYKDGYYYYTHTTGNNITIWKSKTITGVEKSPGKIIWTPPVNQPYSHNIWAPEIHFMEGRWYVYFAAGSGESKPGAPFADQRIWVLESKTADPMGEYVLKGKVSDSSDKWAIDATVLDYNNAKYLVWSGWPGDENISQNIYIAQMDNPWTIKGERVLLSQPEFNWEKIGNPLINEGPRVLYRNNKIHIVYSASGSWTDNYCLGMLTFSGGNILDLSSWSKSKTPVFESANGVYAPGRASFVKSPDKTQDWMVYHTARKKGSAWDRVVKAQMFTWKDNDFPDFGKPVPENSANTVPSGEDGKIDGIKNIFNKETYQIVSNFQSHAIEWKEQEKVIRAIVSADILEQKWIIKEISSGKIAIYAKENLAIGIKSGKIELLPYNNNLSQHWQIIISDNNYHKIRNVSTGSYLTIMPRDDSGLRPLGITSSNPTVWSFHLIETKKVSSEESEETPIKKDTTQDSKEDSKEDSREELETKIPGETSPDTISEERSSIDRTESKTLTDVSENQSVTEEDLSEISDENGILPEDKPENNRSKVFLLIFSTVIVILISTGFILKKRGVF